MYTVIVATLQLVRSPNNQDPSETLLLRKYFMFVHVIKCKFLSKIYKNHYTAIYRDTGVFCLSITGTENFQYRPLLTCDFVC